MLGKIRDTQKREPQKVAHGPGSGQSGPGCPVELKNSSPGEGDKKNHIVAKK